MSRIIYRVPLDEIRQAAQMWDCSGDRAIHRFARRDGITLPANWAVKIDGNDLCITAPETPQDAPKQPDDPGDG